MRKQRELLMEVRETAKLGQVEMVVDSNDPILSYLPPPWRYYSSHQAAWVFTLRCSEDQLKSDEIGALYGQCSTRTWVVGKRLQHCSPPNILVRNSELIATLYAEYRALRTAIFAGEAKEFEGFPKGGYIL